MENIYPEKNEIVTKDTIETENKKNVYSYREICEQLGDLTYFTENQINYIYYKVNHIEDEATKYLNLCLEDNKKLDQRIEMMREK